MFAVPPLTPGANPVQGAFSAAPQAPAGFPGQPGDHFDYRSADQPRDPYRRPGDLADLSRDYRLDLNAIFSRATARFGQALGAMIGYTLVFFVIYLPVAFAVFFINLEIPVLGNLISNMLLAAVYLPLTVGIMYVCLAHLRGQDWSFADFFAGFRYWKPVFLNSVVMYLAMFVCQLPGEALLWAAGVHPSAAFEQMLDIMQGKPVVPLVPANPALAQLGQLTQLVGSLAMLVLYVVYFLHCGYLIVDRRCGALEAIRGNQQIVRGHFWGWLGITLLFGLIGYVPMMCCCVPYLVSWPFYHLLFAAAYLEATEARPLMQQNFGF
jgi:hypothetical protein